MRFTVTGSGIFISVLISNVAGHGDVVEVKVKGSRTGWLSMGRTSVSTSIEKNATKTLTLILAASVTR